MPAPPPLQLDVRPLFAAQRYPLPVILAAVNRLQPNQALQLIAPLEPAPLYEVLAKRGFAHTTREREDGAWEILFEPAADDNDRRS